MNYLAHISATGLKSGDFAHDLTRVNLIIGRSGSGKTARLDAIRLALNGGTLLGRANDLKSRTQDIMDLARDGEIEVKASDDSGRFVHRRWVRGKQVQRVADGIPATPDILMDSSAYLSLSDAKKVEYAFGLFNLFHVEQAKEFSDEAICATLKNIRLDENTAETEAIINSILVSAERDQHDRGDNVQTWLASLIAALKRALGYAKAEAMRMTQTVQGITQLTADAIVRNPWSEIAAERKKLEEIQAERSMLERQLAELAALEQRRSEIESELANLKDDPAAPLRVAQQIEELETDIQRIESSPLALPTDLAKVDEPALRSELDALTIAITSHKSNTRAARDHFTSLEGKFRNLTSAVDFFDGETRRLIAEHQTAMEATNCSHCGAMPEHWAPSKSKLKMQMTFATTLDERNAKKSELTLGLEQADEDRNRVSKILAKCEAADTEQIERQSRERIIHATLSQLGQAQQKARNERDGFLKSKRHLLALARDVRDGMANIGQKRAETRARLDEVLKSIGAQPVEALRECLTIKDILIGATKADIQTLELQRTAFIQAKTDEQRNSQALIEHAKAKANVMVTSAAIEKLEEIQAKMVAAAFETILKTVNLVTAPLIQEPIEYRDGTLGRWVGATFVKFDAFSVGQRLIAAAGISLALAKEAPLKIVLLDDMGNASPEQVSAILQRMIELTNEGVIGQFCGCYSLDGSYSMAGVNTIRV